VIESLRQLGVLRDHSLEHVSRYAFFPVHNRRGDLSERSALVSICEHRRLSNATIADNKATHAHRFREMLRDESMSTQCRRYRVVCQLRRTRCRHPHPSVEEVFQWKQQHHERKVKKSFAFNRARIGSPIGIIQALADNPTERDLHSWIQQLLGALDSAQSN
jgi:hypothetical protein